MKKQVQDIIDQWQFDCTIDSDTLVFSDKRIDELLLPNRLLNRIVREDDCIKRLDFSRCPIIPQIFSNFPYVEEIILPDNLKVLSGNTYVFSHVDSLEYLWIPNTITTTIPANVFSTAPSLTVIELQEGFNISANFSNCTNLTKEAIVNMLYALKNLKGASAKSLTLGETNLAKLSASDIAIATNKNWTLS